MNNQRGLKRKIEEINYDQVRLSMCRKWEENNSLTNGIQVENFIWSHSVSDVIKTCGRLDLLVETLDSELEQCERYKFFDKALPEMVKVVYKNNPALMVALLDKFRNNQSELTLSRFEIACLLANAFFCTYPDDTNMNFSQLYSRSFGCGFRKDKIKCIITYFNEVFEDIGQEFLQQTVTFKRNIIMNLPNFLGSSKPIVPFTVIPNGSIQTAFNMAQVNFANKTIGGGVLGATLLREEKWFITCPELIASRFFSKEMAANEAIIVDGVLQYVKFSDASNFFICQGPMPKSAFRGPHTVISMDALDFSCGSNAAEQYSKAFVDRELVKAYAGFSGTTKTVIATGNWGCGFFSGDSVLKAKIQMIAASQADKALYYYAFSKAELIKKLENDVLVGTRLPGNQTVGEAYSQLLQHASHLYKAGRCSQCNCHSKNST